MHLVRLAQHEVLSMLDKAGLLESPAEGGEQTTDDTAEDGKPYRGDHQKEFESVRIHRRTGFRLRIARSQTSAHGISGPTSQNGVVGF
jgi:hypothetical protein